MQNNKRKVAELQKQIAEHDEVVKEFEANQAARKRKRSQRNTPAGDVAASPP